MRRQLDSNLLPFKPRSPGREYISQAPFHSPFQKHSNKLPLNPDQRIEHIENHMAALREELRSHVQKSTQSEILAC